MLNKEKIQNNFNVISNKINKTNNKIEINNLIEHFVNSTIGSQYSAVWLYDGKTTSLTRQRDNAIAPMNIKKGLFYRCFTTKEAVLYNNLSTERRYNKNADNYDDIDMKSIILIPLLDNYKFIGILTTYLSVENSKIFKPDDKENMEAISPFVIDFILSMNNPKKIDRREKDINSGFSRRESDTLNNIHEIEKFRANVQTTQEILDYTTNVIHDIKVPTNSVLDFLNILEKQIDDERIKKYIYNAKENMLFTRDLAITTLDAIENKRMLSKKKLDLISASKFFIDIAESNSVGMFHKSINYNIYIDPLLPKEIKIDTLKLKRVILNLLTNAFKFTAESGKIEFLVIYRQENKNIKIIIKDTGIGISREKQIKILKAFSEDLTVEDGISFGLKISNNYVNELGGELKFNSEVNIGSSFYFDIPLEIVNKNTKYHLIKEELNITLFINKKDIFVATNITKYLVRMGIDKESITIVNKLNKISESTTHIVVFESVINEELNSFIKYKNIKKLIVEENLLSLKKSTIDDTLLISQYEYYGDTLHSFIDKKRVSKVLIVDDDKIGISVLKAMLSSEICEIEIAKDGYKAIKMLKDALSDNKPYSLLFLDSNISGLSDNKLLEQYRILEDTKELQPIYAVSIVGFNDSTEARYNKFNAFIDKPFNKKEINLVFQNSLKLTP